MHHLHSAHQTQTFTTPPCRLHIGSCLVRDGRWSEGRRDGGRDKETWIGFFLHQNRKLETSGDGSSVGALSVCPFFYAISMIHRLKMDLTCAIGIKIRPAFLVCSSASAFVSFSITSPHLSHKSEKCSLTMQCVFNVMRQEVKV